MHRLTFALPLYVIFPLSIGAAMFWGFLIIFNALRFTQCTTWVPLPPPPGKIAVLRGTLLNRLYIETENKTIYCLKKGQWAKCTLPAYELKPDSAPTWLINQIQPAFQANAADQIIRSDGFPEVTYYSLHADKRVYSCPTQFSTEVENIFNSGLFLWLLVPTLAMLWSLVTFIDIFIKHGQPTIWDFWGRGERIK